MRTLTRTIGKTESGGEPLPPVFRTFEYAQIVLRRSEVSMFAGAPGAGKSTLALALATWMKVPTLYVSADTGAHTMSMRLFSMLGFTPTDRSRLGIAEVKVASKLEQLMQRKAERVASTTAGFSTRSMSARSRPRSWQ